MVKGNIKIKNKGKPTKLTSHLMMYTGQISGSSRKEKERGLEFLFLNSCLFYSRLLLRIKNACCSHEGAGDEGGC